MALLSRVIHVASLGNAALERSSSDVDRLTGEENTSGMGARKHERQALLRIPFIYPLALGLYFLLAHIFQAGTLHGPLQLANTFRFTRRDRQTHLGDSHQQLLLSVLCITLWLAAEFWDVQVPDSAKPLHVQHVFSRADASFNQQTSQAVLARQGGEDDRHQCLPKPIPLQHQEPVRM